MERISIKSGEDVADSILAHHRTHILKALGAVNPKTKLAIYHDSCSPNAFPSNFPRDLIKQMHPGLDQKLWHPEIEIESTALVSPAYHLHHERFWHSNADAWADAGYLGTNSLLRIKFKGLDFPIVLLNYSYQRPATTYSSEDNLFVMRQKNVDAWINFLQTKVKRSATPEITDVSTDLTTNISESSWDNIVLTGPQTKLIRNDLNFFKKNAAYFEGLHIPYRRGYLFYGPPGNGKTACIRAMANQIGGCSYTMSDFADEHALTTFMNMFYKLAGHKTGLVILEDIDRMFPKSGGGKDAIKSNVPISALLNALDGLSDYWGAIIIATANHPRVLDEAILRRPGRFDRVIEFPNPTPELAARYLSMLGGFEPEELRYICSGANQKTKDFSFARWREVYILACQTAHDAGFEKPTVGEIENAILELSNASHELVKGAIGQAINA